MAHNALDGRLTVYRWSAGNNDGKLVTKAISRIFFLTPDNWKSDTNNFCFSTVLIKGHIICLHYVYEWRIEVNSQAYAPVSVCLDGIF